MLDEMCSMNMTGCGNGAQEFIRKDRYPTQNGKTNYLLSLTRAIQSELIQMNRI